MNESTKLCPICGAPAESDKTDGICPFCGAEISDYSRERADAKIADVKTKTKSIKSIPIKIALIVSSTLLFAFLVSILIIVFDIPQKFSDYKIEKEISDCTTAMKECYENEDWDGLYTLVIENASTSLSSPDYFTYRTAWYLHEFPSQFDEAVQKGDMEQIEFIYDLISEDYKLRLENEGYTPWETEPEIDKALEKEYLREKEIYDSLKK